LAGQCAEFDEGSGGRGSEGRSLAVCRGVLDGALLYG